jgi:glycosyltransferase involved in cell wall biosynthesis
MQEPLLFSIIIPTYNRASFINRTIKSALDQSYPHFEIIVVDDGSTDDTEQMIKNIASDRVLYYKKNNAERAAARNYGVRHSTGAYVTFLDSDDLLYEHYLSNAAESIRHFQNPPFLHLGYEITDTNLQSKTKVDSLVTDDIRMFIKGNPLSCMGIFLRKDIAVAYPFNEDRELSGSEDWELWIRIAANAGIKTDNRITAALIDHDSRSVTQYREDKLLKRKNLALQYAFADPAVRQKFGPFYKEIESYWDSYIALHLVLACEAVKGAKYLLAALGKHPLSLFERRTAAIIKHIIKNIGASSNRPV